MPKILLHICCGICAIPAIEQLKKENFGINGFFYNPNIYPQEEYKRRFEISFKVSEIMKFKLLEGNYDQNNWFDLTKEFQNEPEGKTRCRKCFKMRLEETFKKSKELNIPYFSTTLTTSSHKNTLIINQIGEEINKESFLKYNFKKYDGFKVAIEFAKKHQLYRQNYCGCEYSQKI